MVPKDKVTVVQACLTHKSRRLLLLAFRNNLRSV